MLSARTIVTEDSIGGDAWRVLNGDARTAGRRLNSQILVWLRYAAKQRLEGKNLELSPGQLDRLLGRVESPVEFVA
jgi:hypothetical protein